MAQSTAGIKVKFGEATLTNGVWSPPLTWTEIPDITSAPALGSEPEKLETTTLAETKQKTYINGLMDLGGAFEFEANLTPELLAVYDVIADGPTTGAGWAFCIEFPSPLERRYWWIGEMAPIRPVETSVNAVAKAKVYISQETEVYEAEI